MKDACEVLKAVSEPTRIRILRLLIAAEVPLCGLEFVEALSEQHYNLSRHLKILKSVGLLKEQREGRWVFHFLKDNKCVFYSFLIKMISSVDDESGIFGEDSKRLKNVLEKREKKWE